MKASLAVVVVTLAIMTSFLWVPKTASEEKVIIIDPQPQLVREYLESKHSPLAPETKLLLEQKHWKLLIAISAIESQYCTKKIDFNCWGIGGDSAYKHYNSVREAIVDANSLIEKWQKKGRWLTVEDMNCHYVQPCNPNWVRVVNKVLKDLNEQRTGIIPQQK